MLKPLSITAQTWMKLSAENWRVWYGVPVKKTFPRGKKVHRVVSVKKMTGWLTGEQFS